MFNKIFLTTAIVLIAGLNATTQAQTTTMWDATHVATTITHIKTNGAKEGDNTWEFKVDAHESVVISESASECIIDISTRHWSATIFTSESKTFPGNIATMAMDPMLFYDGDTIYLPKDYRYFFRLSSTEKTTMIGKVEAYLRNFSAKKPAQWVAPPPAPGLFEGTDSLTQEFIAFINFIKTNGQKDEDEYTWEKGDVSISWNSRLLFAFIWKGDDSFMVTFDKNQPPTEGKIVRDNHKKITPDQLRHFFSLIKN